MTYYFAGRQGDPVVEKTLHTDRDCPELGGPVRLLADSSAPDDADRCPECSDVGTCTVVKSDGEECGRDRPCPYHD